MPCEEMGPDLGKDVCVLTAPPVSSGDVQDTAGHEEMGLQRAILA